VKASSRRLWGALAGIAISAVALYLAFRGTNFAELRNTFRATRIAPLLVAVALSALSGVVRAIRWRALFAPGVDVSLRYYYTSLMIGYLGNNLLPVRAGDVIRTVLFGKRTSAGVGQAAATLLVERLLDAISLLAIAGILSFVVPLPPQLAPAARIAAVACIVAFGILWRVAYTRRLPRFVQGLHAFRSVRSMAGALSYTGLIWIIEAMMVFMVMRSTSVAASPLAALFLLVIVSLGLLLPAGPAAIGSYELMAVIALSAFAIEKTEALAVAIVLHAMVFCSATTIGLLCLSVEGMTLQSLRRTAS